MQSIRTPRTGASGALAAAVFTALYAGAGPAPAAAQTPQAAEGRLEDIVVTARKREERLQETPVSITAFGLGDIEEKGFQNLEDVARLSPGVQYSQMGGQIPGRFTSAIRFRGMNVNSDSPSLQLGSLFVDGIFVLGGTQSISYDDVERIEVIKGPQAALYGRSTFGGAINYITRTPSMQEYSGQINASLATKDETDVSASFEGPLWADKVAFRLGGRYYDRGALFTASDGGGLGEESSKSVQGTLYLTPFTGFTGRIRGFYNTDSDGPSTGGIVQGARNDTCTGRQISTEDPARPVASPRNFICGAVPEWGVAVAANGSRNVIDTPTTLLVRQAALNGTPNFVVDNIVNRAQPAVISVPPIDDIGLRRNVARYSAAFEYEFAGGYTATLQGGHNRLKANWIRSFGLTPLGYWWSRDPQDSTDTSYEFRIASPGDQRLTWLVGANYYRQKFIQSGSGGDAVWLCSSFVIRPYGSPCANSPAGNFFTGNSLLQNTDRVTTTGFFAAVSFDVTDTVAISLEGRQQRDSAKSAILTTAPARIDTDEFLPRAIVNWTPTPETTVYASYAKGILPGIVNSQIAAATPRELAQYQTQVPGIGPIVPGDELKMYELGWKQQLLDGRAYVNTAAYYGDWKNQKGRQVAVVFEDCTPTSGNRTDPNFCPNGANGQPALRPNSRNVNVAGTSKLWGVELESAWLVTERFDLRASVTWAKSEYEDFQFNFVTPVADYSQMKGNSNARFPEWSGSVSAGYTAPVNERWNWFASTDTSYTGKTYVDESNLAYCKSYFLANVRGGVERQGLRIEAFVRNVTDEDAWASCARWTDFDGAPSILQLTTFQGVAVQPLNPRQYGLRAVVKF